MAQPGYWETQFVKSLPHFLANWYVQDFGDYVVHTCEQAGIDSMIAFTRGLYNADKVGQWACYECKSVASVMNHLRTGNHSALTAMLGCIKHRTWHDDYSKLFNQVRWPADLSDALVAKVGVFVKSTTWWIQNESAIVSHSHRYRMVSSIISS